MAANQFLAPTFLITMFDGISLSLSELAPRGHQHQSGSCVQDDISDVVDQDCERYCQRHQSLKSTWSRELTRTRDGVAAAHIDSCVGVEAGNASYSNIATVNEGYGV
jgi:hypothetical protein